MDYIKSNKQAWENAFDNRSGKYALDLKRRLKEATNPFFYKDFYDVLEQYDFKDKNIVQFCSNNGRELLQVATKGVNKAVGFELAKNMVTYGNEVAKDLSLNATFIEQDILTIDDAYNNQFDYGLITVGALCWFKDLNLFFNKVANTLKEGATLFIHESHPFENILATKDEPAYDKLNSKKITYNYFGKTVWEENSMGYMSDTSSNDHVFTSFSHTLTDIFKAMIDNGLMIQQFKEHDYCVGNILTHLDHEGLPLSMIVVASKQ